MKEIDYCELFAGIEADPEATVRITIGQQQKAAIHALECANCSARVERVLALYSARYPDDKNTIGFNPN